MAIPEFSRHWWQSKTESPQVSYRRQWCQWQQGRKNVRVLPSTHSYVFKSDTLAHVLQAIIFWLADQPKDLTVIAWSIQMTEDPDVDVEVVLTVEV